MTVLSGWRHQGRAIAIDTNNGQALWDNVPPRAPRSDLALVGVYLFDDTVFEAVHAIKPSARGELEITGAIQYLIDTGRRVRSHVITGWWKDTGKVEDLLEANRIVLADLATAIEGTLDRETVIEGQVRIGPGTVIERSRLRGPLVIGAGASIADAYVGPFTALGDGVVLQRCELENSIILGRSRLENLPHRIESSLIGRDVVVMASESRPHEPEHQPHRWRCPLYSEEHIGQHQ